MTNLLPQRKLAAKLMKCGVNRVFIREESSGAVAQALTRRDIAKLIAEGRIRKRRVIGTSRRKARAAHSKVQRGQTKGPGSRKGTQKTRTQPKRQWINKIRLQRKYLKKLREEEYITPKTYRQLYKQAKGNLFRSLRYMHSFIQERDLAEKKLPEFTRRF